MTSIHAYTSITINYPRSNLFSMCNAGTITTRSLKLTCYQLRQPEMALGTSVIVFEDVSNLHQEGNSIDTQFQCYTNTDRNRDTENSIDTNINKQKQTKAERERAP